MDNTLSDDIKEFQTTLNNKLSQEKIELVLSLLTYLTLMLPNNNALKNLYVLGNTCKVDIDLEILKLKTSFLTNGFRFEFEILNKDLDIELSKFIASSINKFILDRNTYDELEDINKAQIDATLMLCYPIFTEYEKLNKKLKTIDGFDIDQLLNSLAVKKITDPNEIINCFFDDILVEENLFEYGYDFNYFDPNLPFYELPYGELANDSPFYIIDENHFGVVITNLKYYHEKPSIIHKYSDVLYSRFEKLSIEDRNNIFFISIFTAYLTSDINKFSIHTLKWFLKKEKENVFVNKIFDLIENRTLSEKSIDEIVKHINEKCYFLKEHRICFALIDIFTVPFSFQDSILKNENINSEVRNKLQKLHNAIFPLKEMIPVCEEFHKKHINIFYNLKSNKSYEIFCKTNHLRLWFLIEGEAW